MIEEIENYINGDDYPDEIPKRIMGLFERKHDELLAEVKRLREQPRVTIDDWDKVVGSEHTGPYVTVYFADGSQYIGALRLYKGECECCDECDDCDGVCQCLGDEE